MDKFNEIKALVSAAEKDAEKFFGQQNSAAGTRLRKHMQDLKNMAQDIRQEVLDARKKDE